MQGLLTTREILGSRQRHRPSPCAPCRAIRVRSLATVRQALGTHRATTAVGDNAPAVLSSFHVGLGEEKYKSQIPTPLMERARKIMDDVTPEIFDILVRRFFLMHDAIGICDTFSSPCPRTPLNEKPTHLDAFAYGPASSWIANGTMWRRQLFPSKFLRSG